MASDMSSGCLEAIDILDDEKEEGEISLEDVSSSEEGGMGHLTCNYVVNKTRQCSDCKSWSECAPWCTMTHRSKSQSRRDPVKGKENRHHVREAGCATTKHTVSTLQEKNDDLVPISSDSDMEIVGLTDTSNRSKARIKKDKRKKKKDYEILTIDDLISPSSVDLSVPEFSTLKTHYRELSPVHRSGRSRVVSKSPIRKHRSSRASFRSSRSPLNHHKSPILRRSERRLRSPKRSSPKRSSPKRSSPKRSSPKRSSPLKTARRPPRLSSPPSTRSYIDRHDDVTRLLKKVKHLDSMGSYALESSVDRNKEHQSSSLKEKLSNMLKRVSDNNDNVTYFKEKSNVQSETVNDADDEEDLALLRQKALETKHKKSNLRSSDQLADAESEKAPIARDNDQDEEALQLRMIALRSAVMKKHQNRVQRGIKTNRKPSRSESPFSQSFLDDTPVAGDELKFASPPCTPSRDSNYIEDMELDTDVEREKEKLPYSPTDKITTNVPIDTMLLGIEPSDVSFINLTEMNNSPIFDDTDERIPLPLSTGIAPYNSYLQQMYESQCYPCSPSQNASKTLHSDLNGGPGEFLNHLRDSHCSSVMCDLIDGICCQSGTYSGIPGLMNASDASSALPVANDASTSSICLNDIPVSTQMQQIAEQSNSGILSANVDSNLRDDMCIYETQAISEYSITDSPMTLAVGHTESASPNESMITLDDLSENETDQLSFPVGDDKNLLATDYILKGIALCQAAEERMLEEPLYMQGVPDVTKDVNKIPTLINKTLVPASLLRTNKQLQQPLPIMRKRETQSEPTFKSAEMQPVIVTADANRNNNGSNFKPIKLRLAKKAAPILTAPVAFDNSMNESLEKDLYPKSFSLSSNSDEGTDLHSANANTVANNDSASIRKKRKRIKKYRHKSLDVAQLLDKRNVSCSNKDVNKNVNIMNAFTLNQQIVEFDQSKSNDDNKQQENLIESRESSNLQNATRIQDQSVSINSADTMMESSDVERNDRTALSTSAEFPQEKSIVSHCLSTSLTPNNSDSTAPDKTAEITKDINDRRQSIDEDENELRAILLASLKRTKPTDTNSASVVPVVTTTTDIQTSTQKTLANTTAFAANTTCTVSNSVSLSSKLNSSETEKKKKTDVMPISTQSGGKRKSSNIETTKGPLKKIAKKAVIPASTKVVNNAKKYQNMIIQKKLNLLKLSNNVKSNENTWSNVNPPKALHVSDTQRFVISLGSDTDSESESERRKALVSTTEKHQAQDINADFEKSLQKFLRDMRKEQEQSAVKPVSSTQATKRDVPPAAQTNKDSSNMHTPLAVRHLPASQQEEYRRLKQQILEREKLKLQKKVADSNNSNNNSNNSNKLLNTNVTASSPIRSISSCEKKDTHIKQNQDKPKESEINAQQSSTEIKKNNVDVGKSASTLNTHPVNKNVSANIAKHTNSAHLQAKGVRKTIPHNLSIRIVNEIAPSHTSAGNRTIENLDEKQQSVSDKQQNRLALRVLTKEEIYRKYAQVKPDTIKRVVTINDKTALQCDTASASQNHKTTENDVNMEIIDEIDRNNENNNTSVFSNASTTKLSNSFVNSSESRREHEDTMEATMLLSQYEAEREINRNISASLPQESNSNNDGKSDVNADNTSDVWDVLKRDVKAELDSLISLPKAEQERYLRDTEHNLVARRYTILDNLAEMSGNLRQWDMEKDLQNSLATEVRKLKEQLRIAEERLQRQRDHVSSMGPKVSSAREKINVGRRECFKLSKICSTLGNQLMGKNYILPEAGGQLLSDKLKEIANHTRQFSKKKRIQWDDVPENSNCVSPQQISKSSKDMQVENNLPLQEYLMNEAPIINTAETNSETFHLKQSNGDENLSISELSLDPQQMFPDQLTPITRKETVVAASDVHNNEQVTPPNGDNVLLFESELCQSTPVQQNDKHAEQTCTMDNSDLTASSEMELSVTDHSICQENEQNDKGTLPQSSPSPTMITTTMTTTTTTTTTTATTATTATKTMTMTMARKTTATTTIAPYISILMHLKTPRNTNPHGVLCPYEMMGICRDEDCQYIHQSRNQT